MKVLKYRRKQHAVYVVTMSNMDHYHIGRAIEIAREFYAKHDPASIHAEHANEQASTMQGLSDRFNEVEDI